MTERTEQLRECPFCGDNNLYIQKTSFADLVCHILPSRCVIAGYGVNITGWNTRTNTERQSGNGLVALDREFLEDLLKPYFYEPGFEGVTTPLGMTIREEITEALLNRFGTVKVDSLKPIDRKTLISLYIMHTDCARIDTSSINAFVDDVCNRFGTVKLPTVEQIEDLIDNPPENKDKTWKLWHCVLGSQDLATAIHQLLTVGEK
jgi:hypothetical protein